jgi:hypothetical protein
MKVYDINAALATIESDPATMSQHHLKLSSATRNMGDAQRKKHRVAAAKQHRGAAFRAAMSRGRRRSANLTEDEKRRYREALAYGPSQGVVEKVSKNGVRYQGRTKKTWAPTAARFGFTKPIERVYLSCFAKGERLEDLS